LLIAELFTSALLLLLLLSDITEAWLQAHKKGWYS